MTPETLEALRGSIAKWKAIVEGTGHDAWAFNCPLCTLFATPVDECQGCPVYAKSAKRLCGGTPYVKWSKLFPSEVAARGRVANTDERKVAAQAELDFLISLLPDEGEGPQRADLCGND